MYIFLKLLLGLGLTWGSGNSYKLLNNTNDTFWHDPHLSTTSSVTTMATNFSRLSPMTTMVRNSTIDDQITEPSFITNESIAPIQISNTTSNFSHVLKQHNKSDSDDLILYGFLGFFGLYSVCNVCIVIFCEKKNIKANKNEKGFKCCYCHSCRKEFYFCNKDEKTDESKQKNSTVLARYPSGCKTEIGTRTPSDRVEIQMLKPPAISYAENYLVNSSKGNNTTLSAFSGATIASASASKPGKNDAGNP